MTDVHDYAKRCIAGGVSVIPVRADGSKQPAIASFNPYKGPAGRLASPHELQTWWQVERPPGVAALCGAISGGLELIDFDGRADLLFPAWRDMVSEAFDSDLMARLCVVRTPREPAGYHVWLRWAGPVPGNLKLARDPGPPPATLIETRGEGGYALLPCCPPECHECKRPYVHVSGPAPWELAPITRDEREALIAFARSLTREEAQAEPIPRSRQGLDLRPGDDFDQRGWDWPQILEPHDWTPRGQAGAERRWARPGKKKGWSATTGHCHSNGADLFRCFSSNADPFEEGKAYGKFRTFALLNCAGDLGAAAKALRGHGFGSPPRSTRKRTADPAPAEPSGEEIERRVATIADLARAGAEVSWLCERWLPRGVLTAIAAEGGTGKTRFCADLLRRVRHQLPWHDGSPMTLPADSRALWVASDNHHDELVTLCRDFGIEDVVLLNAWSDDPYAGVTLEEPGDLRDLELRIQKVRPAFVIVDTVGNATDKNLSKQEDARAFYQPLQVLARRYRCAILCLTHLNALGKFLGRRVLEKVRVAIRMEKPDPDDDRRRLEVYKTNGKTPKPLGLTMGDLGNEYDTNPPKAPAPSDEPGQRPAGDRPTPALDKAVAWLRERLAGVNARVCVVRREADAKQIDSKTLYRAKDVLGVHESEAGGYKWWRLNGREDGEPRTSFE